MWTFISYPPPPPMYVSANRDLPIEPRGRPKIKFLFSGATFHIPLTKSATLNSQAFTLQSMANFRGSFVDFSRALLFAFQERNRPQPPCNFFPTARVIDITVCKGYVAAVPDTRNGPMMLWLKTSGKCRLCVSIRMKYVVMRPSVLAHVTPNPWGKNTLRQWLQDLNRLYCSSLIIIIIFGTLWQGSTVTFGPVK